MSVGRSSSLFILLLFLYKQAFGINKKKCVHVRLIKILSPYIVSIVSPFFLGQLFFFIIMNMGKGQRGILMKLRQIFIDDGRNCGDGDETLLLTERVTQILCGLCH